MGSSRWFDRLFEHPRFRAFVETYLEMKLIIDAGHGKDYRKVREMDFGLLAVDYAARLVGTAAHRRPLHPANIIRSGGIPNRLRFALERKGDILISFHMTQDSSGMPMGRVLFGTEGSRRWVEAISRELKLPVEQVEETVNLLRFNPSVQIELGNIACAAQMRDLQSVEYCDAQCKAILDAIDLENKKEK